MSLRRAWRWAGILALALAALPTVEAYAAIPIVIGPAAALGALLPVILPAIGAALLALLKPATYKVALKYLWTHKLFSVGLIACGWLGVWGLRHLGRGAHEAEQVGAPWVAFRGGPLRTGAVKSARGPQAAARIGWQVKPSARMERVDSSPCVVGNRVYVSSGTFSVTGATSGSLYCLDANRGGQVWKLTADDIPKLKGIFSSPAVGGKFRSLPPRKDGSLEDGKYLVVGEGYHTDFKSRIICLDLEPVKTGQSGAPKVAWTRQTTCHVESSPCIFTVRLPDGREEERAVTGAADDGVWCLRLADGEVLWHIEGTPAYYVEEGPQAEAIGKLAGKLVAVTGVVDRVGATDVEPGEVILRPAAEAREVESPAAAWPDRDLGNPEIEKGFKRTVVGRVEIAAAAPTIVVDTKRVPLKGASRVCLKPPVVCVDVESAPVVAELPKDPAKPEGEKLRLAYFGCGVGGPGLACADADTGKLLWRADAPYPVFGAPTVAGERVLVGMGKGDYVNSAPEPAGEIRCFAARGDGAGKPVQQWTLQLPDTVLGAVAVENGRAYACCRDAKLHVIDLETGREDGKPFPVGSATVCAPAVTADAVYLTTNAGKMFCVDRVRRTLRWTYNVSPGMGIISSPAVAGGRVFVGTVDRGIICLKEDPAAARARGPLAWRGPGGGLDRAGAADVRGLPVVAGKTAEWKWGREAEILKGRTVEGPLAACNGQIYLPVRGRGADEGKVLLGRLSAKTGKETWTPQDLGGDISALAADQDFVYALAGEKGRPQMLHRRRASDGAADWRLPPGFAEGVLALDGDKLAVAAANGSLRVLRAADDQTIWERNVGELAGAPVLAGDLLFAAVGGDKPRLICLSALTGLDLWTAPLPGRPVGPPALAAERLFVGCQGKDAGTGVVVCVRATDGGAKPRGGLDTVAGWTAELPETPVKYPVASDELVVVVTAAGRLFALAAEDGRSLRDEGMVVGREAQPPVLVQGVLVFAGANRVGTWNPLTANWPWALRDQGLLGRPLSPPAVAAETVFVASEKQGLVAVAPPPPPDIVKVVPEDGARVAGPRPYLEAAYADEVSEIDLATVEAELVGEGGAEKPQVLIRHGACAFDWPEQHLKKGDMVSPNRATFTSLGPLAPGAYRVTFTVGNKRGACAVRTWSLTVKEGSR